MKNTCRAAFVVTMGLLLSSVGFAQYQHPGCQNLSANQFQAKELLNKNGTSGARSDATLSEPVQFDLVPITINGQLSHVDAYIIERKGKLKYYNGRTETLHTLGDLDVWSEHEGGDNGLMGIALDPDFLTNRWVYLWYGPNATIDGTANGNPQIRLSRFKVTNTLEKNTEKILINILGSKKGSRLSWYPPHAGGPMTFDSHGDLWITVGNNSQDFQYYSDNGGPFSTDSVYSDEWGSSNTANMRGSILRIHPDENASNGKYSIPEGNFGEYWADQFEKQGKSSALVAQYRNPNKVLPEIYTKGHRSNYSISVHPTKRWLTWGEVSSKESKDEFNIVTNPVFAGYPYFQGNQDKASATYTNQPRANTSVSAPRNTSPLNSGVQDLPPAYAPDFAQLAGAGYSHITGPVYVFDSSLAVQTKFPPHLHESWMTFDYVKNLMWIHTLKDQGGSKTINSSDRVSDNGKLFANLPIRKPIQSKFGPDGSLYILNYGGSPYKDNENPGLFKVDYKGSCYVYSPKAPSSVSPNFRDQDLGFEITAGEVVFEQGGKHSLFLYDPQGVLVYQVLGKGSAQYSLEKIADKHNFSEGLYVAQAKLGTKSLKQLIYLK